MQLPGRLRATTLGDILGMLHRARTTGTLELVEDRGRTHRVHVSAGLVAAVELDGAGSSLGEILRRDGTVNDDTLRRSLLRAMASRRLHGDVLVRDFMIAPEVVGRALREQLTHRLTRLEQIVDARVQFRVAVRPPRSALDDALGPDEFLVGRRRARDRASPPPSGTWRRDGGPRAAAERSQPPAENAQAWRVLGLAPGASPDELKRAFRHLARSYHPDLHPGVSDDARRTLELRFAEVTAAYRALVA